LAIQCILFEIQNVSDKELLCSLWICMVLLDRIACTTYVDAAYCYLPSSVVCPSVTVVSPAKIPEPIQMSFGLRTWVGPRNHLLDEGPDPPIETGNFEGGTLQSSVQKRLNRLRCRLGCQLGWAQGIMC